MHTNTAAAEKNRQSGIEKIVEILNSDVIIFPKTILRCDEVYEERSAPRPKFSHQRKVFCPKYSI